MDKKIIQAKILTQQWVFFKRSSAIYCILINIV